MTKAPTLEELKEKIRDIRVKIKQEEIENINYRYLCDELFKSYTLLWKLYNIGAEQVN